MKAKSSIPTFVSVQVSTRRTTLFLSAALLSIFGSVWASEAPSSPAGGDGRGLSVRLEMPWTTLRVGEIVQYRYILYNASDEAVPVASPDAGTGEGAHFGWPAGGQPYLEPEWPAGMPMEQLSPFSSPLAVDKAQWPPRDAYGQEMRGWLELPAGQRIVWNQNRLPGSYFGVLSYLGLQSVRAHWLVGPGCWISSDVVPLKVLSVPMSEWKEVFTAQWSSYGYGKDQCSAKAYVIPLERKSFLFMDSFRVTEVSPDDRFGHTVDMAGTNLEIAITGSAGTRKVYYHLRHGLTSDTPWPIGPVELFYPKPESIPPVELEILRNAAQLSTAPPAAGGRPEKKFDTKPPSGDDPASVQDDGKEVWFWITVSLVAFVATLILVTLRKLRQHASTNSDSNGNLEH